MHHAVVDRGKGAAFIIRPRQRLDHADARIIVPHLAHHAVHGALQIGIEHDPAHGHDNDDDGQERHHREQDEREHRFDHERERHAADDEDGRAHAQSLHHADHVMYVVGIRRKTGYERRDGKFVRLPCGERERLDEEIAAETFRRIARDA